MNWTDNQEMVLLKNIADELSEFSMKEKTDDVATYFRKRSDGENRIENIIMAYNSYKPEEIKHMLEKAWDNEAKGHMMKFVTPVTVAMLKNKGKQVSDGSISRYVYEF